VWRNIENYTTKESTLKGWIDIMPAKITTVEFIKRADKIHEGTYDYSGVRCTGGRKKVNIKCKRHGIFSQTVERHLSGAGCRFCNAHQKKTTVEFIDNCVSVHGSKYDYTKVQYLRDNSKVEILCKIHGSFFQCPKDHFRLGCGCPECKRDKMRYTTDEFIAKAKNRHGNRYDYSLSDYTGNQDKITIVCQIHGKFKQKAKDHLLGCGCQKCNRKISKTEIQFLDIIGIPEECRQYRISGTKYQADGYDKSTNTVWEFLGDHWHGNPKIKDPNKPICLNSNTTFGDLYKKTLQKFSRLIDLGYNINYVWEFDWKIWKKDTTKILKICKYKK